MAFASGQVEPRRRPAIRRCARSTRRRWPCTPPPPSPSHDAACRDRATGRRAGAGTRLAPASVPARGRQPKRPRRARDAGDSPHAAAAPPIGRRRSRSTVAAPHAVASDLPSRRTPASRRRTRRPAASGTDAPRRPLQWRSDSRGRPPRRRANRLAASSQKGAVATAGFFTRLSKKVATSF